MMRLAALLLGLTMAFAAAGAEAAVSPDEMLDDPVLEQRARALGQQLRCLVCQNQSIDDSDAPLARDLRQIVRERLVAGDTDEEIKRYLVDRYGKFVLLKPPVEPSTWLLWAGPFIVLLAAGLGVGWYLRRGPGVDSSSPPELSDEERRRLEALLTGSGRS